jgi:GntR family transcriptional regulator, transcriptional repressor for pyruvate dehydrogenase complex
VTGRRFELVRGDASEQIADGIRHYVAREGLEPGDRLGTEQELAAEFGVSRPTLREALRMLSGSHLVRATRGPGGGIFVQSTPNEGLRLNLSESIATMLETGSVSLRELVDTRMFLEVPLAGLAATHATDSTADDLDAAIADAAGNVPGTEAFNAADTRFHRVIATAAGNELMNAFTSWVLDVLQPSLIAAVGAYIDGDAILDQHREIARAVRRGQVTGAERAMTRHIAYMREVLEGSAL